MELDIVSLLWNSASVVATVVIHSLGTMLIVAERPRMFDAASRHGKVLLGQLVIMVVVVQLLALHLAEIVFWGVCLRALGFFSGLKSSVYFAGISYTSLGYSGALPATRIGLSEVLIAIVGLLMFGWSIGVLVTTVVQYERMAFGFDPSSPLPVKSGSAIPLGAPSHRRS